MADTISHLQDIDLVVVHPIGRGGSLFLQSLFDGHPAIITLPSCGELYSRIEETIVELDAAVAGFIAAAPHVFDSSKGYFGLGIGTVAGRFGADGTKDLVVNTDDFIKHAKELGASCFTGKRPIARRDFFRLVHIAYARCLGNRSMEDMRYILYHPHLEREFETLVKDFPQARFVVMTRDPRQDWESWRKVLALRRGCDASQFTALDMLYTGAGYSQSAREIGRVAERLMPGHIKFFDLPRFHSLNKRAIFHLCDWLGLRFQDSLLESTFNGSLWSGNSADRNRMAGFNPEFRDKWRQSLSTQESAFVSTINFGAMAYLRYEPAQENAIEEFDVLANGLLSHRVLLGNLFLSISASFLACFAPLQARDSAAQHLRQIVGRVRRFLEAIGRMGGYYHLRNRDLPVIIRRIREQQDYLQTQRLPDDAFLIELSVP